MASKWDDKWWIAGVTMAFLLLTLWRIMSWTNVPFIPEREEFNRIRTLPYDEAAMNCTHKAILYAIHLKANGWKRWIVVGSVENSKKEHAWVIVEDKKGIRRLCDPTGPIGGPSGYPEDEYKTYKPRIYSDEGTIIR